MANHAIEVIGGILGFPSKDASDVDQNKSSKSKSGRNRRHTTENVPRRKSSLTNSRRSSRDSRPPSGSGKYELDELAQESIRRKRKTSVKENMVIHTIEAVSSAIDGMKAKLISPRVAVSLERPQSATAVAVASNVGSTEVPITTANIEDATPASTTLESNGSIPTEKVTEATPVDNKA